MGSLAAAVEDEGHPEPDFPDRDPSPYDILREAAEGAVADVEWTLRNPPMALQMLRTIRSDLERAMYLAAGGAE